MSGVFPMRTSPILHSCLLHPVIGGRLNHRLFACGLALSSAKGKLHRRMEEGRRYLFMRFCFVSLQLPPAASIPQSHSPALPLSVEYGTPKGLAHPLLLAPKSSTLFCSAHNFVNSLFTKASLDYPSLIMLSASCWD